MPIYLFFIPFGFFILFVLISVLSSKNKNKAKKDKPQGDFTVTSGPDKTMFSNDSNKTEKVTDTFLKFPKTGKTDASVHSSESHVYVEPDYSYSETSASYTGLTLDESRKLHQKNMKKREKEIKKRNQIRK